MKDNPFHLLVAFEISLSFSLPIERTLLVPSKIRKLETAR